MWTSCCYRNRDKFFTLLAGAWAQEVRCGWRWSFDHAECLRGFREGQEMAWDAIARIFTQTQFLFWKINPLFYVLQHQKSSQWCQEHFLNYKGLLRAMTVREQLRRLLNKFKVPRTSSEGRTSFLIKHMKANKIKWWNPKVVLDNQISHALWFTVKWTLCSLYAEVVEMLVFQFLYILLFISSGDPDVILRCIVSGFFANAARLHHSGSYRWDVLLHLSLSCVDFLMICCFLSLQCHKSFPKQVIFCHLLYYSSYKYAFSLFSIRTIMYSN